MRTLNVSGRGRMAWMACVVGCALMVCGLRGAMALDVITATVTVTNAPIGNTNTITVNASTRTFTNTITASPSTLIQETNSVEYAATNVLNHFSQYTSGAGHFLSQSTESNVTIRALPGRALTVTIAGLWGYVTYSTNTTTDATVVRVPLTVEAETNRTNIASHLVTGLDYATTSVSTNARALSNFLTKGAAPLQRVTGPVLFNSVSGTNSGLTNGTVVGATIINAQNVSGTVSAITNGIWTNGVLISPKTTNLVNYGNAISSPGASGTSSEQFGTSAAATGNSSTAVGNTATASGTASVALGAAAQANNSATVSIGSGADAEGPTSIAIGQASYTDAVGTNAIAIGWEAFANFEESMAFGSGNSTTERYEILLGGGNHVLRGPRFEGITTNATFKGTNTLNGRLDYTSRANSALANGYNSGVVLGTNVYVKLSGPTGAYTNVGFAASGAAVDGTYHVVQVDNPGLSFTLLDDSGLEATAANRIKTGTGALVNSTNNPVMMTLIYDGTAQRWRLLNIR